MPTQFLTCKFKIHNPSAQKRTVMDYALEQYTLGFEELLDYAYQNLERIERDGLYTDKTGKAKYTAKSIGGLLPRTVQALHSSAKDSLIIDVSGSLASYLELRKINPKTSFCSRNFSLLWDREEDRLFAALWLLPARHPLCRPINATAGNLIRLDTSEVFRSNSQSAILVPLEIGQNGWHLDKFLSPTLDQALAVKSAFLVRDDRQGEYFLHVSFAFDVPRRYQPMAYLGIDKGILFTAAYAIVDQEGSLITLDHFNDELRELQIRHGQVREKLAKNGKKVTWYHYKRQEYESLLHGLVNELIGMAQDYQAQIVVEDLSIQVKGSRIVSRFRKLDRFLEYKCRLSGVPFRRVFASYSSQICPRCGETIKRDNRHVSCSYCGYDGHSDDSAAVNIARRALYRKDDWKNRGGYRAFHRSFRPSSLTLPAVLSNLAIEKRRQDLSQLALF